ncbi:DUF2802 domain-containing protein [Gilvimarinus polysaccharolyticus]|uniref:DUF2802 domain-containing protein n=1 Tax=Gilvimarinus polysaccharolyticus TaxID=863921 RepID=UPI00067391F7|nr:DUF2802 domain-containing protein [Gilvimarinus polysaccharolyticus]
MITMSALAEAPYEILIIIGVGLAVALLALVLSIGVLKKVARNSEQTQQRLTRLERELVLLQSGAQGMGQRILTMEAKNTRAGSPSSEARLKPYSEATHLLSLGVDRDEVANRCGLSRAETSLLDALRSQKQ